MTASQISTPALSSDSAAEPASRPSVNTIARWSRAGTNAGMWGIVAAAYAVGFPFAYAFIMRAQDRRAAGSIAGELLATTIPSLVVGIVAWRLSPRLTARGPFGLAAAHVAGATVCGAILALAALLRVIVGPGGGSIQDFIRYSLPWQMMFGTMLYGLIAGASRVVSAERRLRDHEAAAARAEVARVQAQLETLQGKLDPHFLFNTLHSLNAIARDDPPAVQIALVQLSELLRYVLEVRKSGSDDVPLSEEWKFIDHYIALEKLRFGDRLEVLQSLDDEALECKVPAFLLQPIVENAIHHGLGGDQATGCISIAAHVEDETLILSVRDNGAGADPRELFRADGMGLALVRERLALRFGDKGSLDFRTAPGDGCEVKLTLPATVWYAKTRAPAGTNDHR